MPNLDHKILKAKGDIGLLENQHTSQVYQKSCATHDPYNVLLSSLSCPTAQPTQLTALKLSIHIKLKFNPQLPDWNLNSTHPIPYQRKNQKGN